MNHRYIQIIATCLIVGTITFALRQNKSSCPCAIKDKTIFEMDSNISGANLETPKKQEKAEEKKIIIEPDISSKKLAVQHGFFSYSPTSISLTINDAELEVNNYDPITIKIDDKNMVTTNCKYKFIAGYEGENTSKWKVKPGEKYTVSFNWKTPEKIQIEGAELLSTHKGSEADFEEDEEDDDDSEATESTTTQAAKTSSPKHITADIKQQAQDKTTTLLTVKNETPLTTSKKSA